MGRGARIHHHRVTRPTPRDRPRLPRAGGVFSSPPRSILWYTVVLCGTRYARPRTNAYWRAPRYTVVLCGVPRVGMVRHGTGTDGRYSAVSCRARRVPRDTNVYHSIPRGGLSKKSVGAGYRPNLPHTHLGTRVPPDTSPHTRHVTITLRKIYTHPRKKTLFAAARFAYRWGWVDQLEAPRASPPHWHVGPDHWPAVRGTGPELPPLPSGLRTLDIGDTE